MRNLPSKKFPVKTILMGIILIIFAGLIFWFKKTRIVSPLPPDTGIRVIILQPTPSPTPVGPKTVPIGGAELD